MKELRLTLFEIKRIFRAKRNWLYLAAFIIAPFLFCTDMFGLGNNYGGTMTDVFMLFPAKSAALAGVAAALFLTLAEMQRMTKYRMNAIIETTTNPLRNQLRQTAAIIAVAAISLLASLAVVLPYTMICLSEVFKFRPFLASWIFIYFGAILITILFSSGLYMATRNFEISFIASGILVALGCFSIGGNYLLYWVQTSVTMFSDATVSMLQIDVIMYNRLVWLLASSGVYFLGTSCMRTYGNNLANSLLLSLKKVFRPAMFVILATCCILAFYYEPFIDKGPIIKDQRSVDPKTGIVIYTVDDSSFNMDMSMNKNISFSGAKANMTVDAVKRQIYGEAAYNVSNPTGRPQEVPFGITPGLELLEVYENGVKIGFTKNKLDSYMQSVYHLRLSADKEATLRIVYQGSPKGDRSFQRRQWGITDEFVLIPYIFPIPTAVWDLTIECSLNLPENLTPIMEETSFKVSPSSIPEYKRYEWAGRRKWLIAGEYNIERINAGGQEIQFIHLKGLEQVMKDTNAFAVVADVVDFFTEKFGPLDFGGMPFIIAELDGSFVGGGWGLGNMSVFGETCFAGTGYKGYPGSENVEGGSGITVAVHEIAHQWWGWSPDSVYVPEDPQSPWSGEGLTVYSTYLYMKDRYGAEYAKHEFTDVWESDTRKMQNAFYLNNLKYATKLSDNDAANIYSTFAGITRYETMPYLLLKAERLAGGEDAFVAQLSKISQKYRRSELSYSAFLRELGLKREDMTID